MPDPTDARAVTLALLAKRAQAATVCPSEVARAVATAAGPDGGCWREAMPAVHAAIDDLVAARLVRLSWKGTTLAGRVGPYRIGRGTED